MVRNKYSSVRTTYDNKNFASKLEASVYALLKMQGYQNIVCQKSVYLSEAKIQYIVDFFCQDIIGADVYVEAKGFETAIWKLKRKLWKVYGPGLLLVYKGSAARPFLHEEIIPR
jgi:hypothetical protein